MEQLLQAPAGKSITGWWELELISSILTCLGTKTYITLFSLSLLILESLFSMDLYQQTHFLSNFDPDSKWTQP